MKIITYSLNEDGTIPDFIVDGGYFPIPRDAASPQDLTLLGIAVDDAPGPVITDVYAYLVSIGGESWTNIDGEPIDLVAAANFINELVAA